MNAVENVVGGGAGAARPAQTGKQGGLAPSGAQNLYGLAWEVSLLWGGIVVEAESNTIVVQKYSKREGKYYRWRVTVSKVEVEVVE
jgi:hypothetical protein